MATGAGRRALLLPGPLPTPVLAYAVRSTRRVAGVMVTASHNPPQDNGYKVYLGAALGGERAPGRRSCRRSTPRSRRPSGRRAAARRAAGRRRRGARRPDVLRGYLDGVRRRGGPGRSPRELTVAYTPMHGVGGEVFVAALDRGRLRRAGGRRGAGRAGPRLPHRRLPQPGGAGRDGPGAGAGRADRRGPGDRQRPGRRPVRGRPSRCAAPAGGCCAATRSGVLLADHLMRRGVGRPVRHHDRLLLAAAGALRGPRAALRRDADRVQVDRPGAARRLGLRVRGGARATAWRRSWSATRTASPPPCCWPSWPPA